MMRPVLVAAVVFGAGCGSMMMMPDGGTAGGRAGGSAGGSTAGGSAGGATAGGSAGGAMAGGSAGGAAGGATAGGAAGGATAGGSAGGATAGGMTAGGAAGGATAGGSAGGATAGGSAGGAAGGSAGGATAGGTAGGAALDPACLPTAYDAGVPGGALFPDGGFTPPGMVILPDAGVTATAVSSFGLSFGPRNVLDFDLDTSWYIAASACAPGPVAPLECCATEVLTVQLPSARSVSAIVIRGNRDFADDYDFLTGRLELLDASGVVITSRPIVFSRPDSDWATVFSPFVANVRTVRFVPGWSENEGGLSELQVFSP